MVSFLKRLFLILAAISLASLLFVVIGVVLLGRFATSFIEVDTEPSIEPGAVLRLDLAITLRDAPSESPFDDWLIGLLTGEAVERVTLRQSIDALRAAANDERISGVVITGTWLPDLYGASLPVLRELRQALLDFKASGKPIKAQLSYAMARELYVTSVADEVTALPSAFVDFRGLASERLYVKGALDKLGIEMQVFRAGDYKTAFETLERTDMSPEQREELTRLLNALWFDLRQGIADGRETTPASLSRLAAEGGLLEGAQIVDAGLADQLLDEDAWLDHLIDWAGASEDPERLYSHVTLPEYVATLARPNPFAEQVVAIVYVEGAITAGVSEPDMAGSDTIVARLREVREDPAVAAVVVRINSPGGSALAGEAIAQAVANTAAVKPVIASLGGIAASAGYQIAAAADLIVTESATVTGSIGVLAALPSLEALGERWGLNWDSVRTERYADLFSAGSTLDPDERALIDTLITRTYNRFLDWVAEHRPLDRSAVESLAGGRVFTGREAIENALADAVGGLEDALAAAASRADLEPGSYAVWEWPEPLTPAEAFAQLFESQHSPQALHRALEPSLRTALRGLLAPSSPLEARFGGGPLLRGGSQAQLQELETLLRLNDPLDLYALAPWVSWR